MIEAAYELLRIERNASPEAARNAYVRLVRRYPPEHFPEKFAKLREAYQRLTLCDDFVSATVKRMNKHENLIDLAACLWGDRRELRHDTQLAPEELMTLIEEKNIRFDLDELLMSITDEIEWKTGGNE